MFTTDKANGEPPISLSKQALMNAHARLSTPGAWVQHNPHEPGQDCLETAIAAGFGWVRNTLWMNPPREFHIAYEAARRAVNHWRERQMMLPVAQLQLSAWNDSPGRTLDEVLAALQEAISLVDAVGREYAEKEIPPLYFEGAYISETMVIAPVSIPDYYPVLDMKVLHGTPPDACWNA